MSEKSSYNYILNLILRDNINKKRIKSIEWMELNRLFLPTAGLPTAMAAASWIEDISVLRPKKRLIEKSALK